jgi:hypothetical protein
MLGNDQRRIRLALALTMALPGTPILMYGDEIGMGEDLSLPGRLAVRNPMQWSPRHAGGFSTADTLYRPARAEGPYGYRTVNVLDQRHQPGSLYSWMAHAIRVRRECPEIGWATGARSRSVTRACWPSRHTGAMAAWSHCTICPPNRRRSACRTTWMSGRKQKQQKCAKSSATPNPHACPARRSRSAVTDSAGCACSTEALPPGPALHDIVEELVRL